MRKCGRPSRRAIRLAVALSCLAAPSDPLHRPAPDVRGGTVPFDARQVAPLEEQVEAAGGVSAWDDWLE